MVSREKAEEIRLFTHSNETVFIVRRAQIRIENQAVSPGNRRINEVCTEARVQFDIIKESYGFTVRFYRHCGDEWGSSKISPFLEKEPKQGLKKELISELFFRGCNGE